MSIKFKISKTVAGSSSFVLKKVLHRPGGFYPGKLALKIDDNLFEEYANMLDGGSVLVTGTNGKTSVTALLADCLEKSGADVICNRTGANMATGIATALLQHKFSGKQGEANAENVAQANPENAAQANPENTAQTGNTKNPANKSIGIFETDELWVEKVLGKLKSNYLVLLDLFPDQEDRFGGIDTIQNSLLKALESSPETTLIYNADDPNCAFVAQKTKNATIGFGVNEKISGQQNNPEGGQNLTNPTEEFPPENCPMCGKTLDYKIRQYAQLGHFSCEKCGFTRIQPQYFATDIKMDVDQLDFTIKCPAEVKIHTQNAAEYMVYNLVGYVTTAIELGCSPDKITDTIAHQKNADARLQYFDVGKKRIMINLAKNPAGFNQNIKYVIDRVSQTSSHHELQATAENPVTVAFFANAREGDGRSTEWLKDVDFDKFKDLDFVNIFIGGEAFQDLSARMKDLDIVAHRVSNVKDLIDESGISDQIYIIANYTAVFPLHAELKRISEENDSEQA